MQHSPAIPTYDAALAQAIDAAVSSGIEAIDATGLKIHANEAFCRMVGWRRQELIGARPPFVYWPEEHASEIIRIFELVLDGRFPPEGVRTIFKRRDGERFPVLLLVAPLLNRDRNHGWVANFIDLSEQERQAQALRQSEERFRLAQEGAHVGVWEWHVTTGNTYWSPECARIFGVSQDTPRRDEEWRSRVHPDDLASLDRAWLEAANEGRSFDLEYRFRLDSGDMRWIQTKGHAHRDTSGTIVRLIGINLDATLRKQQELALHESEARLLEAQQTALKAAEERFSFAEESARTGFWEWKPASGDMTWTPGMYRVLGLDARETTPDFRHLRNVIHPDDRDDAFAKAREALASRHTVFARFRIITTTGDIRWIDAVGRASFNDDGVATRVAGLMIDATELRQADVARRRSEAETLAARARLEAAMASMSDSVYVSDETGRPIEFNDAFVRLHRFESREACGRVLQSTAAHGEIFELYLPDGTLSRVEDWPTPRALRGETGTSVEYRVRRTDTGASWMCSYSFAPIRGSDAGIIGAITTARDITDQKRAEQALRDNQERQALLIRLHDKMRSLTEPGDMLTEAARLVGTHAGALRAGYAEDAGDGAQLIITGIYVNGALAPQPRMAYDTFSAHDRRRLRAGLSVIDPGHGGNPRSGERASISIPLLKDGRLQALFFMHFDAPRDWVDEDVSFVEDLAARIWAEVQRARMEQMLATQAEVLRQAKEAADAANVAKSAFLANMSHEIRTPLHAIKGMAYLLSRSETTSTQRSQLDKIMSTSDHLQEIIDSVLELSKIEAGRFELDDAPVMVNGLIASVAEIVQAPAREKGLEIRLDLPTVNVALRGDPTRLRQALLNYAANAIKFTARGVITFKAAVVEETADTLLWRFEVQDTGIGIAPEALSRLFKPFEQADNSLTRAFGGTGLGLAITRSLARIMGGDAGAVSAIGAGSTFWFTARLHKAAQTPTTPNIAPPESAERTLARSYGQCRILVAEDDELNLELITEFMALAGLKIDAARDGIEAIELAARTRYDIVLMDMQMPRMDGLEAIRRMRELPGYTHVPIITLTGNAFGGDRDRCMAAGSNDFLTKPFDADKLFRYLLRWLDKKASA